MTERYRLYEHEDHHRREAIDRLDQMLLLKKQLEQVSVSCA